MSQAAKEHGDDLAQGIVLAMLGGMPVTLGTAKDVAQALMLNEFEDELRDKCKIPEGLSAAEQSAWKKGRDSMLVAVQDWLNVS